ncbi:MAG: alpha/beta fold hydrolase [Magnetococcus sp. YQC-3]
MSTTSTLPHTLLHIGMLLLLAIPLLLYPLLYFNQEQLLFFPRPLSPWAKKMLLERAPQGEIRLTATDGTPLHGWLINPATTGRLPLLIYWGGNAEEISGFLLEEAPHYQNWTVLAVNYRGYGESGGKPSERALFADAQQIFDWAAQLPGIDPRRIVVMGRSLGSGVAVQVAATRPVAGVCLVSPYDSIRSLAQEIYPLAPVKWLLKHPFDSLAQAPSIRAPLLALLASDDTVVPPHHSRLLIAAWGGPQQEKMLPGADHENITTAAGYLDAVRHFLATITPPEVPSP